MSVLTLRNGAFVPGTVQNITTSASNQRSNAVSSTASIVRIAVNQDTFVAIGANAVASNASMLMTAGSSEYIAVQPGVSQVAVLQVSASGIASITELTGY
jgi:hypothetical protein